MNSLELAIYYNEIVHVVQQEKMLKTLQLTFCNPYVLVLLLLFQGIDGVELASFAAKLLAVNTVARDMLPGYSEPLLCDTFVNTWNHDVSLTSSLC